DNPFLNRLGTLVLSYPTEQEMQALCCSPHLTRLRALDLLQSEESLPENFLGEWFTGLSNPLPVSLQQLDRLVLWYGNLNDADLRSPLASPVARTLTALDLTNNPLSSEGVGRLVHAPLFSRLQELSLRQVSCEDMAPFHALVRRLGEGRLRRLSLQSCQ